ncbi:MAG: hypothetical protein WCQ48_03215 [Chloroflexota bacterium]
MSTFKKFAAPLLAVALVAVMGVSLLTSMKKAEAAAPAFTSLLFTAGASTAAGTASNVTATITPTANGRGVNAMVIAGWDAGFVAGTNIVAAPTVTVTGTAACSGWTATYAGTTLSLNGPICVTATTYVVTIAIAQLPAANAVGAATTVLTSADLPASTNPAGFTITAAPTAQGAGTVVATGSIAGTSWNNTTIAVRNTSTLLLTESGAATWTTAQTITLVHAGLQLSNVTITQAGVTGSTVTPLAGSTVITIGTVSAAVDTITITQYDVVPTANAAETTVAVTCAACTGTPGSIATSRLVVGWQNGSTTFVAPINRTTASSFVADNNGVGGAVCAVSANASGVIDQGLAVTFQVSIGVVSTGTSKSAAVISAPAGSSCTNYRGGGGIVTTDTVIASNPLSNIVSTLALNLTAPTGGTASKIIIQQPNNLAIAPTVTNVSPGYISPDISTNSAIQVQDATGLGVNGQTVLITIDKGYLAAGFGTACGTTTSKALTATTVFGSLVVGGTNVNGTAAFTICGNQLDAPGTATVTASNVTTSMANATVTLSAAGRPNKVAATFNNGVINALVTDAAGNKVADATAVQFTISNTAGAVSNACTTTTNGAAQSAVSLNGTSGTVIVTANWNETGAASTCVAAGAQSTSTVVSITNGVATVTGGTPTTTPTPAPAAGAGGFAAAPVFSASKLAQSVFNGGTVAQLEATVTAANGTGAWAQDSKGNFVLDIIGGGFVNDAFKAAFSNGFAGVTALTVVGK